MTGSTSSVTPVLRFSKFVGVVGVTGKVPPLDFRVSFAPPETTTDGSGYTAIEVGKDGCVYVGAARYGGYATLAGLAGIVLAGQNGAANPQAGAYYLLPAFAGAFLGSTTIRPGRAKSVSMTARVARP